MEIDYLIDNYNFEQKKKRVIYIDIKILINKKIKYIKIYKI